MKKEEICVYIENEAQLNEARAILEKAGENIDNNYFYLIKKIEFNYLQFSEVSEGWFLATPKEKYKVSISDFKQLFEPKKDVVKEAFDNIPKIKIGINETVTDVILSKFATMSMIDFHSWITMHANDLKQHEINMLADAYYDGLTFEPFDRLTQTQAYCVQRFKHVPKIEEK